MRLVFVWVMIAGLLGISICDLCTKHYKLAAAELLLVVVQWLIFGKG